ncbi:PC-esterase domain-containing protein 1A-like isoform X2 [Anabas testudineus]|uniref:PC-esterase domain-containing protein 1A-like isoform X2 n=1 Tax=Anabas testudineus TaxID=64144 RepID=UPI000E45DEC1|nr:PC-esterase domain-containing protein 1A-like isoform X2 [Anabas testudineus]
MKETLQAVSHQRASQLLHNKFIVVLGDSIQRSVYKDLVLLLQKEKYLTLSQLKSKGEMSFEQDCLVEGGCLGEMHNGTEYREVRQFQSAHHLVRFYFVTRIYSRYMQSILEDFRNGLKPDVVIVNSCIWDISRYSSIWIDDYKKHLHRFFDDLNGTLPKESLVIWSLTMPLGERIRGGFLVPEIEHKSSHLRYDVIEANFYSATLADAYGMDVLDLHFHFRFCLHHRTNDGAHWNALAHRNITTLLLQHIAQAWGITMSSPLTPVEYPYQRPVYGNAIKPAVKTTGVCRVAGAPKYYCPPSSNYFSNKERHRTHGNYDGYLEEFFNDSPSFGYLNFEDNNPQPQTYHHDGTLPSQPHLPGHRHQYKHGQDRNGSVYNPPHHFKLYNKQQQQQHQYVMRSKHTRYHYAPYTRHRPSQYNRHGHYY